METRLLEKLSMKEAPFQDLCHYVWAPEDRYSLCGIDVSEAEWKCPDCTPLCPECEFKHASCPCDLCIKARGE